MSSVEYMYRSWRRKYRPTPRLQPASVRGKEIWNTLCAEEDIRRRHYRAVCNRLRMHGLTAYKKHRQDELSPCFEDFRYFDIQIGVGVYAAEECLCNNLMRHRDDCIVTTTMTNRRHFRCLMKRSDDLGFTLEKDVYVEAADPTHCRRWECLVVRQLSAKQQRKRHNELRRAALSPV